VQVSSYSITTSMTSSGEYTGLSELYKTYSSCPHGRRHDFLCRGAKPRAWGQRKIDTVEH